MITLIFTILFILVVYNHIVYPLILKKIKVESNQKIKEVFSDDKRKVAVVVSAYNEEKFIENKIMDFKKLNFKNKHLFVFNDASTDKTSEILGKYLKDADITIINKETNKGKVNSINHYINVFSKNYDYTVFTDVSSSFESDFIEKTLSHFSKKENISVVSSAYYPHENSKDMKYWLFQRELKKKEEQMGNVIGVHGSGYMIKNTFLNPLPINTINDDFVLPSKTIINGGKVIYSDVPTYELENDNANELNYVRRIRIGAGNIQQTFSCWKLLNVFERPLTAINFFSMKVLRSLMPVILMTMVLLVPFVENILISKIATIGLAFVVGYILLFNFLESIQNSKLASLPYYILKSYYYSGIGIFYFLIAKRIKGWYEPMFSRRISFFKRFFDFTTALFLLILSLPILIIAVIALKIEDMNAPIFFKQKRVGIIKENGQQLFEVIKLRTMIVDAEKGTGAVFATRGDPRITKVGRFLRKSRIDEIPQFFNVILGDMSLVGPRPERPEIMSELKKDLPDFYKRTEYTKPGITGLAQVRIGYNETLADLSEKYKIDQEYKKLSNESIFDNIYQDIKIMLFTVLIVVSMKGI